MNFLKGVGPILVDNNKNSSCYLIKNQGSLLQEDPKKNTKLLVSA